MKYPTTPDGRYFLVRGRLWRTSNPSLSPERRDALVHELMSARSAVRLALKSGAALPEARARVHAAKLALGERGPVWWTDGSPDLNRHLAKNTPYAEWAAKL
ncbi:hypothetical protein GCM10009422_06570 [Brevundimonas kwangchunensis]|uniref:Integrase n=1 Tax=Brevundimonas kwangchunensis TaxID=322163 RepID=A0ABP3RP32_9CAUL